MVLLVDSKERLVLLEWLGVTAIIQVPSRYLRFDYTYTGTYTGW